VSPLVVGTVVSVAAPVVSVAAPVVSVAAPVVSVAAPVVSVASPSPPQPRAPKEVSIMTVTALRNIAFISIVVFSL
jgi:hypothetical protein